MANFVRAKTNLISEITRASRGEKLLINDLDRDVLLGALVIAEINLKREDAQFQRTRFELLFVSDLCTSAYVPRPSLWPVDMYSFSAKKGENAPSVVVVVVIVGVGF